MSYLWFTLSKIIQDCYNFCMLVFAKWGVYVCSISCPWGSLKEYTVIIQWCVAEWVHYSSVLYSLYSITAKPTPQQNNHTDTKTYYCAENFGPLVENWRMKHPDWCKKSPLFLPKRWNSSCSRRGWIASIAKQTSGPKNMQYWKNKAHIL